MSDPERLTLEVLGEELTIRSRGDAEVTREAIARLEEKVSGIQDAASDASDLQISLLAALNLAGELVRAEDRAGASNLSEDLEARIETTRDTVLQFLDEGQFSSETLNSGHG